MLLLEEEGVLTLAHCLINFPEASYILDRADDDLLFEDDNMVCISRCGLSDDAFVDRSSFVSFVVADEEVVVGSLLLFFLPLLSISTKKLNNTLPIFCAVAVSHISYCINSSCRRETMQKEKEEMRWSIQNSNDQVFTSE